MSLFTFSNLPKAEHDFRVAIAFADFNEKITHEMAHRARKVFQKCGISRENIFLQNVAGAFELPFAAKILQNSGNFDGVLTIGAIIRGQTAHFELVANETARGIMELNLRGEIPVAFGVLSCNEESLAIARIEKADEFAAALISQMNFAANAVGQKFD